MRFIFKVDKDDCFKSAEIRDLTSLEFLILHKALKRYVFNDTDRKIRDAMVAEIERGVHNPSRPLEAYDGCKELEDCTWK